MGIGFVIVVRPRAARRALGILGGLRASPVVIGAIEAGARGVVYRDQAP